MGSDDHNFSERMDAVPSDELFERYVAGQCTPEEGAAAERWLAGDPRRASAIQAMRMGLAEAPSFDAEVMLGRVQARIAHAARHPVPLVVANRRWTMRFAAAAAIIVVGFSWFAAHRYLADRSAATVVTAVPAVREYVTKRAQRADVLLSDGTRVILAPESRLRVTDAYGTDARDVELAGKGYFEVLHDGTRPFRIHTAAGVAEDIGTVFGVTVYPEMGGAEVVVSHGAVAFGAPTAGITPVLLGPGDVARLDDATGHMAVRHGVDAEAQLAWTKGTLRFHRVPLREVIPQLARWYDLDFQLGDAPADRVLAAFPYTALIGSEPSAQVLELLAKAAGARIERRGRAIVLHAMPVLSVP